MEIKGYVFKEDKGSTLYEADRMLDYMDNLRDEELLVIERVAGNDEQVVFSWFVREDGEQLELDLEREVK
jgi:hypothetical protein